MTINNESKLEAQALTLADIERINETEGAEAADAALQRMKLAREAREAEAPETKAPSDLESLEHWLGNLEVGAGESAAEVIEHLDELDASFEDTAKAKSEARLAAMLAAYAAANATANAAAKAEARLVQEPTPALRPNTATPAVQAVAVAEKAESPSDVESLAHLLGDLGVGAGESDGAVIEDLSELDAYAAKVEAEVGASECPGSVYKGCPGTEPACFSAKRLQGGAWAGNPLKTHMFFRRASTRGCRGSAYNGCRGTAVSY